MGDLCKWETEQYKEYRDCSWESIQDLLKDVYLISKNDTNFEDNYTHLVVHNLKILSENGLGTISFRQWKCFKAYYSSYKKKTSKVEDLFKKD